MTDCLFYYARPGIAFRETQFMGGEFLILGGDVYLTGCIFINFSIFSNSLGGGGYVANFGGTVVITGCIFQYAGAFVCTQGLGYLFFLGGGVTSITGVIIATNIGTCFLLPSTHPPTHPPIQTLFPPPSFHPPTHHLFLLFPPSTHPPTVYIHAPSLPLLPAPLSPPLPSNPPTHPPTIHHLLISSFQKLTHPPTHLPQRRGRVLWGGGLACSQAVGSVSSLGLSTLPMCPWALESAWAFKRRYVPPTHPPTHPPSHPPTQSTLPMCPWLWRRHGLSNGGTSHPPTHPLIHPTYLPTQPIHPPKPLAHSSAFEPLPNPPTHPPTYPPTHPPSSSRWAPASTSGPAPCRQPNPLSSLEQGWVSPPTWAPGCPSSRYVHVLPPTHPFKPYSSQ